MSLLGVPPKVPREELLNAGADANDRTAAGAAPLHTAGVGETEGVSCAEF